MNKKGWLRILEAVLAILLITGALLLIYRAQQETFNEARYIDEWQNQILLLIADNTTLRNATINKDNQTIKDFITENLLPNLNFTILICDVTEVCPLDPVYYSSDRDIFVTERIISGTLEEYSPKKIRFFVWKEI